MTEKQLAAIDKAAEQAKQGRAQLVCGLPGMEKTKAAITYCSLHPESLYFSFRRLDAQFAPMAFASRYPQIFDNCRTWEEFFQSLLVYSKEKRPTVFFDSAGERNDKDSFYEELSRFQEAGQGTAGFVFIGRPWENFSVEYNTVPAEKNTVSELRHHNKNDIETEELLKISGLTAMIPALLSEYDFSLKAEANIRKMLRTDSAFYRLAIDWMRDSFRAPEAYNTLLYAMTHGYNRISELASFTGFPKNKCDKYLKALAAHGLIRKEERKNGHSRYYPENNYLTLWYSTLLTAVPMADGSFSEETCEAFMQVFNDTVMPRQYRKLCHHWLQDHLGSIPGVGKEALNPANYNVELNGIIFDFACFSGRPVFALCITKLDEMIRRHEWQKIVKATTENSPFYDNEYVICSMVRPADSLWTATRGVENVCIHQKKTIMGSF